MSFDFCNALTTFQNYIKSSLQKYLNHFITAYLNDVFIYNETKKEHEKQVLKILKQLRKRESQLNIDKCEFFISEVKYLKMYVKVNNIRMNSKKVQTILN